VTASPQRGQVYRCDLGYGLKPWLVVSNNARNRLLDDIIAIRLTTTARDLPTWVKLSPADPLTGYANADCIEQLGKDELGEYLGALSPASMRGVNQALAIALALTLGRADTTNPARGPVEATRINAICVPGGQAPSSPSRPRTGRRAFSRPYPSLSVTLLTGITSGPTLNPSSAGCRLTARCSRSWSG
jgi:mRNA interferase MazF